MTGLGTPEAQLRELHQAAERISDRLVALEVDSTRKLLESMALSGESAVRWSAASATLTDLWRRRELLQALLAKADELHAAKRAEELAQLLGADSVEFASSDVALTDRWLFGTTRTSRRCSPAELLDGMAAAFSEVKTVMADIDAAWAELTPELDAAREVVRESEKLQAEVGESGRRDLEAASETVARLTASLASDPLAVSPESVNRAAAELGRIRDDLLASAALKRGFAERIGVARDLAERLRSAVEDARAAREELIVKIVLPAAPPDPSRPDRIIAELDQITETARLGAWRPARTALDDWTARLEIALDSTRQAMAALRAPIEARNQFRALLEAYQVKAKVLGLIEDPDMNEIIVRAREALYTAPTDLAVAARLVRAYQQAISGTPTAEEDRT